MLTLQELKQVVSNREERRKVPSAKYLRENGVAVARQRLVDCAEIIAYQTGYVLYCVGDYALQDHLSSIERKLENIKDSVFCVDLNCFSEGDIVRIKDFEGNEFAVNVSGWFCPERGSSNEIYVNWLENGVNSVYGGIYISYGDYEMTEDGIPIPCVEDELIVRFSEVNNKLEEVIDSIAEILNKIENKYIELEI